VSVATIFRPGRDAVVETQKQLRSICNPGDGIAVTSAWHRAAADQPMDGMEAAYSYGVTQVLCGQQTIVTRREAVSSSAPPNRWQRAATSDHVDTGRRYVSDEREAGMARGSARRR
jgi:hypothetical protein